MLDSLTIFTKGGLILYQYESSTTASSKKKNEILLNQFMTSIFLDPTFTTTNQTRRITIESQIVEWQSSSQDASVIAVASYSQVVLKGKKNKSLNWIQFLLQACLKAWLSHEEKYNLVVRNGGDTRSTDFDKVFQILVKEAELMGQQLKEDNEPSLIEDEKEEKEESTAAPSSKQHKGGKQRVWHDGNAKVTKDAMKSLDYSKETPEGGGGDGTIPEDSAALAEARAAFLPSQEEIEAEEKSEKDALAASSSADNSWTSSIKGFMDQLSGNKVLTEQDLDTSLVEMQKLLTSKNVSSDVANEICNGVKSKLVGKRMNSFHRVDTAVQQALKSSISKLLEPPQSSSKVVDVLRGVMTKRDASKSFLSSSKDASNKPYTIVMVGINGVGKSTSLAKIAYYLKSHGCSPMLAACDTFRSGAVEQLNVHAKCLDVPLYHKGYAKDPSAVAKAAIAQAQQDKHDVVLVDTAGRMQNNVPLMKALSKLVVENQPDLVLFVCEALVGNDGMDQLQMFNKALRSGGHSRQIDGIVLTKFDAVSDKVGAALTMTHTTGAPVVFVGTGQKYNHLKKLSVESVMSSLFS